jgi:hypothetical protein
VTLSGIELATFRFVIDDDDDDDDDDEDEADDEERVAKAMCSGINSHCLPGCVLWQCAGRQRPSFLSRVNPTIAEGDPQWLCLLFSGINKGSRNGGFIVCERGRKGFEGNFIEVQNTGRK